MNLDSALDVGKEAHVRGDLRRARAAYQAILAHEPSHLEALHLTGVVELQEGNSTRAVSLLERVVERGASSDKYLANLGLAYLSNEQASDAEAVFRRILERSPDHVQSLANVARLMMEREEWDAAIPLYEKLAVLAPTVGEFLNNFAIALLRAGSPERAAELFERALHANARSTVSADNLSILQRAMPPLEQCEFWEKWVADVPLCPGAWYALGIARIRNGQPNEALQALTRSVVQAPTYTNGFLSLSRLHRREGRLAEARAAAKRALMVDSKAVEPWWNMACVAREQRDVQMANTASREVLALDPTHREAIVFVASTYAMEGDVEGLADFLDEYGEAIGDDALRDVVIATSLEKSDSAKARSILHEILEREPKNAAALSLLSSMADTTEDRQKARAFYESMPDLPGHEGSHRLFELARICDKLKDYEAAFGYAVRANERHTNPYSASQSTRTVERVERVFSPEWLKGAVVGDSVARPIFVVGMPRSGTTLTERICARHPNMSGVGESNGLSEIVHAVSNTLAGNIQYPESAIAISEEMIQAMAAEYHSFLARDWAELDGQRTVDKMPGNYMLLGVAHRMFPGARFVWCRRDWRDNLISLYFGAFSGAHAYAYSVQDIVHQYRLHERYMRHWQSLGIPIHEHRYSDVIADTEGAVRRLLDFLGEDFHPDCLEFYRGTDRVITMSHRQVRKPIYTSSNERWRNYERELVARLGDRVETGEL